MGKYLFITDLDASLLKHDYTYEEAKPVLAELARRDYPLILNSSKTLSELMDFATELKSTAPVIAENGGAVAIHQDSELEVPAGATELGNYQLIHAGMSRTEVLRCAHQLRSEKGYQFEGFSDWSAEHLASITKLSPEAASRAMDRHVTEPILWTDSEIAFEQFEQALSKQGIQIIRGGKFTHLMGQVDKAGGAQIATQLYQTSFPNTQWTTVALGDSENDLQMLEQADIAVVIPHDGEYRLKPKNQHTLFATQDASAGWAEIVSSIIH